MVQRSLSTNLSKNTALFHALLPLDDSFDLITRDLKLGNTPAYWIGVNGFCKTEILHKFFPTCRTPSIHWIPNPGSPSLCAEQTGVCPGVTDFLYRYDSAKYSQWPLCPSGRRFCTGRDHRCPYLSCPQHFQPDTERITRGARDGFVETLLFNTNLIRRRVRSPKLTFSICSLGAESRTDVAIAYLADQVNEELLDTLKKKLSQLQITSLTMGSKSLEELLIKKRW